MPSALKSQQLFGDGSPGNLKSKVSERQRSRFVKCTIVPLFALCARIHRTRRVELSIDASFKLDARWHYRAKLHSKVAFKVNLDSLDDCYLKRGTYAVVFKYLKCERAKHEKEKKKKSYALRYVRNS